MSFIEGRNNDAQWVALTFNGINLIISLLIVRSSKEGSRKKSLFKFFIFLLILVLILYYALREFYFFTPFEI
jgi:hypothetical protein